MKKKRNSKVVSNLVKSDITKLPKPSCKLAFFRFKTKFLSIAKKEITLFPKSDYSLSFKPFLLTQGLVVLLMIFIAVSFFIPHNKFSQAEVIQTAVTKQTSMVVAGGNPVQWTALVKRSDIKSGKYLLKLPKGASNIEITTITAKKAEAVLKAKPKEQLPLKQRQNIALAAPKKSDTGFFQNLPLFYLPTLATP